MTEQTNIPYDWPEIEEQVREAINAMASILQTFGPQDDGAIVNAFLGQAVEIARRDLYEQRGDREHRYHRHAIYRHARAAWCYAYQLDGWDSFTDENNYEIDCGLLSGGYAQTDSDGEVTGLNFRNDLALRRVLETACARWGWTRYENDLSVRQLSLLSNMSETTVRSS